MEKFEKVLKKAKIFFWARICYIIIGISIQIPLLAIFFTKLADLESDIDLTYLFVILGVFVVISIGNVLLWFFHFSKFKYADIINSVYILKKEKVSSKLRKSIRYGDIIKKWDYEISAKDGRFEEWLEETVNKKPSMISGFNMFFLSF